MFSIFKIKEFSDNENKQIQNILDNFEKQLDKADIEIKQKTKIKNSLETARLIKFFWNPTFNVKNGILGAFRWYKKNQIEISYVFKANSRIMYCVVETIIHECHHKNQFRENPILFVIYCLPFLRFIIENPTDKITKISKRIVENSIK